LAGTEGRGGTGGAGDRHDDPGAFVSANGDRSYDDLGSWLEDLRRSWFRGEPKSDADVSTSFQSSTSVSSSSSVGTSSDSDVTTAR